MNKFVAQQPNVEFKYPQVNWGSLESHRLILARYKSDDKVTTLIRVDRDHYIMIGALNNSPSKGDVIESVTGMDWLLLHLDFIRYYAEDDKLVLSGS